MVRGDIRPGSRKYSKLVQVVALQEVEVEEGGNRSCIRSDNRLQHLYGSQIVDQ